MKSLIIDPMALWGVEMPEPEMWALIRAAYQMREALGAVEWIEEIGENVRFCPACKRYEAFGHYPCCNLAAALKKARGES